MEAREGAACHSSMGFAHTMVECVQAYDPTICTSYFPSGAGGMGGTTLRSIKADPPREAIPWQLANSTTQKAPISMT